MPTSRSIRGTTPRHASELDKHCLHGHASYQGRTSVNRIIHKRVAGVTGRPNHVVENVEVPA